MKTPDFITIQNDGQTILSTNYFSSEHAARGFYYLSLNAGAFRLLVPDSLVPVIQEWATAREVIVSRGPWTAQGRSDAIEILFEDDTDSPYAIHLVSEQVERMPLDTDRDRKDQPPRWTFAAWTRSGIQIGLPCRYRLVKYIPWLKSF